jgi:hypothetical protein
MSNEIPAILEPRDEAQLAQDLADFEAQRLAFVKQEEEAIATRSSALAKLSALGLTPEEIASL